jgi:hypothetical protein
MKAHIKSIGDERLTKVPADLDLKPYRDEHDTDLLQRMAAAIDEGRVPPDRDKAQLAEAVGATLAVVRAKRDRARAGRHRSDHMHIE